MIDHQTILSIESIRFKMAMNARADIVLDQRDHRTWLSAAGPTGLSHAGKMRRMHE